jgi:hypothetical protein
LLFERKSLFVLDLDLGNFDGVVWFNLEGNSLSGEGLDEKLISNSLSMKEGKESFIQVGYLVLQKYIFPL